MDFTVKYVDHMWRDDRTPELKWKVYYKEEYDPYSVFLEGVQDFGMFLKIPKICACHRVCFHDQFGKNFADDLFQMGSRGLAVRLASEFEKMSVKLIDIQMSVFINFQIWWLDCVSDGWKRKRFKGEDLGKDQWKTQTWRP